MRMHMRSLVALSFASAYAMACYGMRMRMLWHGMRVRMRSLVGGTSCDSVSVRKGLSTSLWWRRICKAWFLVPPLTQSVHKAKERMEI